MTNKIELYHGDCLEFMETLPDQSIDAIITDPPYGTTRCKWDSIIPFDDMWKQLKRIIKPNGAIVLFGSQPFTSALIMSNIEWFKYCWYWNKNFKTGHLNAKKQPMRSMEDIVVFYHNQPTYNAQGLTSYNKVKARGKNTKLYGDYGGTSFQEYTGYPHQNLSFKRDLPSLHLTQKPVVLMSYLVNTYTNEGETVLDFTMGSGTTGVSCIETNRGFIGCELDDKYFEIAQKRIQESQSKLTIFNI